MLVSDKGKFIFIHVQKTAGTSIERVLMNNYPDARYWHGKHGHAVNGIREIRREKWDEYFSFAFVRNPWERLVSWYTMIQAFKHSLPPEKQNSDKPFNMPFWDHAVANSNDFESFLKNCTDIIYEMGCYKSYAFNQVDYLTDENGEIAVNFVGRFENLSRDIHHVFDRLNITMDKLPVSIKTDHEHYSRYYNPVTRKLIEERFCRDIKMFGYQYSAPDHVNPDSSGNPDFV